MNYSAIVNVVGFTMIMESQTRTQCFINRSMTIVNMIDLLPTIWTCSLDASSNPIGIRISIIKFPSPQSTSIAPFARRIYLHHIFSFYTMTGILNALWQLVPFRKHWRPWNHWVNNMIMVQLSFNDIVILFKYFHELHFYES